MAATTIQWVQETATWFVGNEQLLDTFVLTGPPAAVDACLRSLKTMVLGCHPVTGPMSPLAIFDRGREKRAAGECMSEPWRGSPSEPFNDRDECFLIDCRTLGVPHMRWVGDAFCRMFPDASLPGGIGYVPVSSVGSAGHQNVARILQFLAVHTEPLMVFCDVERSLHPHVIRHLVATIRDQEHGWSGRPRGRLVTTQSPVVLNEFNRTPENILIARPDGRVDRLTDIHDREWLAHFYVGDLYDRLEFGAPTKVLPVVNDDDVATVNR